MGVRLTVTNVADDGSGADDVHEIRVYGADGRDPVPADSNDSDRLATIAAADTGGPYTYDHAAGSATWRYLAVAVDQAGARPVAELNLSSIVPGVDPPAPSTHVADYIAALEAVAGANAVTAAQESALDAFFASLTSNGLYDEATPANSLMRLFYLSYRLPWPCPIVPFIDVGGSASNVGALDSALYVPASGMQSGAISRYMSSPQSDVFVSTNDSGHLVVDTPVLDAPNGQIIWSASNQSRWFNLGSNGFIGVNNYNNPYRISGAGLNVAGAKVASRLQGGGTTIYHSSGVLGSDTNAPPTQALNGDLRIYNSGLSDPNFVRAAGAGYALTAAQAGALVSALDTLRAALEA